VSDQNTDSGKKKHYETGSSPGLMECKAKKMWTPMNKGEKTVEAPTLFSRVLKKLGGDQRIHGGGGTADPWEILDMVPVNYHYCHPSYLLYYLLALDLPR
jgi:hypothetical protein